MARGFSLSGIGSVQVKGSLYTLEHNRSNGRVLAKLDNGEKGGTASVQVLSQSAIHTITDRNTTDNTCARP